jgi:predicted unusual protein kinase regulating ubiquinone biosynthesis (AarF/ABC1/UbiB family)
VRAKKLVATIAGLGPTFIKLAQVLSARADLVPEPYLSEIGTLQDRVPPIGARIAMDVVAEELGRSLEEVFERFDEEPVAAASLGQVHRARFQGREVAVKVLRPGVDDVVAVDLDLSFRLLFWLNILFPNHHIRGITNVVREFSVRVREEMDFRSEASNMARFHRSFDDTPGVRAPGVVPELSTSRVLVMEYLEGTKVDRLEPRFASGELDLDSVMRRLAGLYLRMMMLDGFLHADPHPGNLMVADDGAIVVLDWGMVLEVPRWTRDSILAIAVSVEREDLDGVISGMYQLGMISPEVSRGEVREAAMEVFRIMERARSSSRERIQEIVQELLDTFYTWPLLLPQELVYFFRAAVLLEGIGFRYDPEFNGLELMRTVVREYRSDLLRRTSREPMAAARDMVGEVAHVLRSARDLLQRVEREEFRVRIHPRDHQMQERFLHLQARRFLLSVFATATAVISAVLYVAVSNLWILVLGLGAALVMFVLVLFIPTHLLENPLRHARGIRPR